MLRCDTHIHTRWSKDAVTTPEELIPRCQEVGLTCIAVTDHDAIEGAFAVRDAAPFRVIVGEEVMSAGGEIIGLFLKEFIPPGMSPLDTVKAIRSQGGLVQLPHPFDFRRSAIGKWPGLADLVPFVDIVEGYNSHCFTREPNQRARRFAAEHGLRQVAVTDSHRPADLGHTYFELPDFDGTAAGFKEALAQATCVTGKGRLTHRFPTAARLLRRLIPVRL